MEHENIPRKRAKFTNFVKNIRRGVRPTTIDKTWELFEQALKKKDTAPEAKKEEESEDTSQKLEDISHGNVAVEKEGKSKKKKKEKKRKKQEKEEEVVAASVENGADTNGEDVEERDGIKMFKGTKKFKKKDKNKKGEKDEIAKLSKDQMEAENGIEDSEKSKKKKKKKEKKRMENGCVNGTHLQGVVLQEIFDGEYSGSAQTDYSDFDHPVCSDFNLTVNGNEATLASGGQQSSKGTLVFDGNKFTLTLSSSLPIKPSSSHSGFTVTGLKGEFKPDGKEGRVSLNLVGSGCGCHDGARGGGNLKKPA